eukprot:CAMPEP_0181533640 /NCGR_PEP_ID=MMETSP1110-20121109/73261_1 /TAXON_ID=174948 /ORGANISM="Symbiodinium sp., Strain CCMP421" /LENGTH=59 /DNA_ID=CAMNT_0023664829 /DNA_START=96 /DNA_END=275 /DNA_ORIENTATION=+
MTGVVAHCTAFSSCTPATGCTIQMSLALSLSSSAFPLYLLSLGSRFSEQLADKKPPSWG